jgi:predicted nucleic acid-binding protein
MNLGDRLRGLNRVYVDSSPLIYYVEFHPNRAIQLDAFFDRVTQESMTAVTSPITLAECLVYPFKTADPKLLGRFTDLIVDGAGVEFVLVDRDVAVHAAEVRAKYRLSLLDALHVAVAIKARCDALLTNDGLFRRVRDLPIIVLDDYSS